MTVVKEQIMNEPMIAQPDVTDTLIMAMTDAVDGLRDLACLMVNAHHPQKEHLEWHAEQLYGAAAVIESWIEALLEMETAL